jgi:DNA-binding XRE family transcriptional regulator
MLFSQRGLKQKEVKDKMEISALIKKSRNESGMTQEQAAESLGVSRQTVSNWENGKSYPDIIWFKQGTFIFTSLNMNV